METILQCSRKTRKIYTSKDITFESNSCIDIALMSADKTSNLLIYVVEVRNWGTLLTWETYNMLTDVIII